MEITSLPLSDSPRRILVWLAFFAFALIGVSSGATGVLLPSLSTFYRVDNSVLGLLFFSSTIGYLLSAFSSGLAIEGLGYRWTLILGAAMSLLGSFVFSLQPPFLFVLIMRALAGMGAGIIEASLNSYVTTLPRRTSILNSLHAFFGVGALIGPVLATAILALSLGWNWVYFVLAVSNGLLLVGVALFFPQKKLRAARDGEEEPGIGKILSASLKMRIIWIATFFLLFYVGIETNAGSWSYSFLTDWRHEGTLFAGWIVSGYWLGLSLGRFTQSQIFERFGWDNAALLQACIAESVIGMLLVWLVPSGAAAAIGLILVGYGFGPIYPTVVALMPGLVPPRMVSSAIGFLVSLSIPGIAIFPWIAGILAQEIGLWTLWPFTLLLTGIMFLFWLPLRRHDGKQSEVAVEGGEQMRAEV